MDKKKILIAISNNRSELNISFVKSVIEILSFTSSKGYAVGMTFFDNYDVPTMRNNAVEAALSSDVDYVFFLDADMIYPHDSLVTLLSHDKEVVQGFYVTRRLPTLPVHFNTIKLDGHLAEESNRVFPEHGLVEQAAGGFGGVLVRRDVLEKMQFPYFKLYFDEQETGKVLLGEDIYFFLQLEKLGIKAWLDCDLHFGHLINGAMYPDKKVKMQA